jgi:pimeloyl-ACP methyl ester carboxylesterase
MAEMTPAETAERGAVRGTVAAGGKGLEYEWLGPGPAAAPTLVFLHDGQGCVDTWRDFPAALAAATGCGALVYSRAGYGGSEGLPGPWPVSFMHDEAQATLPEVVAALGVRDGFLVGHSDGASISLIYAATSGAAGAGAPGSWLRGMALEAPHVFVEPVCLESIARLAALYRQPDLWRRMVRHHGANAQGCAESWAEVWLRPEFRSWRIEDLLPRVRCPVLTIQGDQDPYGTLEQLRAVAAGCGGPTETLVLESCGHTPHRQQRDATLAAMSGFVRRLL